MGDRLGTPGVVGLFLLFAATRSRPLVEPTTLVELMNINFFPISLLHADIVVYGVRIA